MSELDRATALVRQAEADIRKVLSDAAKSGDYASVVQIAGWARVLSDMLTSRGRPVATPAVEKPPKRVRVEHSHTPRASRRRLRSSNHGYPQFHRQGDRLVRVAWSKRDKGEYEHKASFSVVRTVTAAIAERGSDGRVFATSEILSVADDDGAEIPSYQVYVTIAFLKQAGLLDQHGRQGYSIPEPSGFLGALEAVLRSLPEK